MSRCHAVAKPNDRVFFAACAAAGAAILLGCVLPAFELYLYATIGGGDSQRSFDYYRDLRLITYSEPGALVFPLTGAALVVLGIAGAARPRWWLVVAAAALTVPAFVQTVKTVDYATGPGDGGVHTCDQQASLERCIGYFAPAIREFRADILRKPEARERDYLGPGKTDFNISRLAGWKLVGWAVVVFSLVSWFRALLLVVPDVPRASLLFVLLVLVVFFVVVVWWFRNFES